MNATLTATRRILTRAKGCTFEQRDEETGKVRSQVTLDRQAWDDMGRPDVVTLTVEPGDLPNP